MDNNTIAGLYGTDIYHIDSITNKMVYISKEWINKTFGVRR